MKIGGPPDIPLPFNGDNGIHLHMGPHSPIKLCAPVVCTSRDECWPTQIGGPLVVFWFFLNFNYSDYLFIYFVEDVEKEINVSTCKVVVNAEKPLILLLWWLLCIYLSFVHCWCMSLAKRPPFQMPVPLIAGSCRPTLALWQKH